MTAVEELMSEFESVIEDWEKSGISDEDEILSKIARTNFRFEHHSQTHYKPSLYVSFRTWHHWAFVAAVCLYIKGI